MHTPSHATSRLMHGAVMRTCAPEADNVRQVAQKGHAVAAPKRRDAVPLVLEPKREHTARVCMLVRLDRRCGAMMRAKHQPAGIAIWGGSWFQPRAWAHS
eukprot:6942418-Prymnesium_polylepis.2